MKATVILNQQAGSVIKGAGEFGPGQLGEAFSKVGIEAQVRAVPAGDIADAAKTALAEGVDTVVAAGGDGTIAAVAGALAGTGTPLGVLPVGTLNHFAKDLGLPDDWRGAVATIAEGVIASIDVASVNDRIFINNCSIGAYPEAVRRREALRALHGWRKWTAMFVASVEVLRRLRRVRLTLETEGGTLQRRTPLFVVANNKYGGNLLTRSLRPRLDEGQLWIYCTHLHRAWPLLRLALHSLRHRLDEADELESWPAAALTLSFPNHVLSVALDGEVLSLISPLRFAIRPGALRVFTPVRQP